MGKLRISLPPAGTLVALMGAAAIAMPGAALSATTQHGYVTTSLGLPATNTQVNAYGRDVDGDGDRDNALGRFFSTLAAQGLDFQPALDAAITSGNLLMLHSLRTPSLTKTRNATWQVRYAKATPNPDFSGSGAFHIATTPRSARLPARITNHQVKTAAGTIPLRLDLGYGVFTLSLRQGKVFARCSRGGCSDGRTNGAIRAGQVDAMVQHLADWFTTLVARDCPTVNSCAADSVGKTIEDLFDTNENLEITTEELRTNSLVGSFLVLDLDLVKANGKPGHDGVEDALSVGVGFDAVRARLKP